MRHRQNARTFRMLNVLDDYNRQVLRIEADTCLPARRVIRVLEQLEESRGLPSMIRVDNDPEFISSFRDECLNVHWFLSLDYARTKIETWRRDYNAYRPHQSLDGLSPEMYLDAYHPDRADFLLLTG